MMNLDITLIIIIGLNCLISFKGFKDYEFFNKFKFNVGAIKQGEQYRNISCGFLHADTQHLLFNMVSLFFFGPIVIHSFGRYVFVMIYVASLLMGSLLSYQFNKHNNYYSAIGASGAVTGIVFAAIVMYPDMKINFIIPGWIFGIGYLVYSIVGMKKQLGNIGHAAHFGGAIAGYLITIVLGYEKAFSNGIVNDFYLFTITNKMVTLFIGLPIVILFFLMKKGKV